MIPLLSRAEVRALDADAVQRLGVPGCVLMENAGGQAAALLAAKFPERLNNVVILGGAGQNGGDAWVVARHLRVLGITPRCFLLGARERVNGDALINLNVLGAIGQSVEVLSSIDTLNEALQRASLVIDGLFGTGLDRPLEGLARAVVEAVASARLKVVALDLPSGVDADTGQVLGAAMRADLTITFAAHKPGLYLYPGAALAGEVRGVSIGVPVAHAMSMGILQANDVARWLPRRPPDGHKGTHGHVLVVAGSAGKTGAALLCGSGALRMGAGLVTLASDAETRRALDHKVLELMTAEIDAAGRLNSALALAQGKAACVMGPGLGLDSDTRAFARGLSLALPLPTVLDADALTAWSGDVARLKQAKGPRVLTPHPGEASRLLERPTLELSRDRIASARKLADETGQVVVLKGAGTVIADAGGNVRISRSGTPALGTAGTGDVLSGIIGALCAQLPAFDAACCGVELHARAGELAALSDRGLIASDLLPALARALEACRERG